MAHRLALAGLVLAVCLTYLSPSTGAQGLVRESEGQYRSFPAVSRFRSFLPPEVDLSGSFPSPRAQGPQASSTGWAVGYALRSYYERQRRGWDLADKHHLFSPAFVYNQLAGGDPSCTRGATISEALTLLQRRGAASLADFPYDPGHCSATPGPDLIAAAARFRIDEWRRVDTSAPDDIKGELQSGNPVVFGMDVSTSFEGLQRGEVYDDTKAPRTIAHTMVLVGYSEERQAFKLINSWGTGWADGGFGWISYHALAKFSDRAFVVRVAGMPPPEQMLAQARSPGLSETVAAPARPVPTAATTPAIPLSIPGTPPPKAPIRKAAAPTNARAMGEVLSGFQCAKLDLVDSGAGRRVMGFVASDADRSRLRQDLAGRALDDGVAIHPWPECEALLTFDRELQEPRGLSVTVAAPDPVLREGGKLVVEITTPDFPSYLYVTYLQASGDAVHLRQPPALGRALPPHTKLRIGGDEPDQPVIRVGPPFGHEMVVAMATASPLFAEDRPATEFERDYLTAYRAALLAKSAVGNTRRLVAAAVATLTTAPR